jgi:uncharacterized protein (DUF2252 family)
MADADGDEADVADGAVECAPGDAGGAAAQAHSQPRREHEIATREARESMTHSTSTPLASITLSRRRSWVRERWPRTLIAASCGPHAPALAIAYRQPMKQHASTLTSASMKLDWTLPATLAREQLARDVASTEGHASLLDRKLARMTSSPFAFLRGAAPLFYSLLALDPDLAAGPDGEGWLVGDAHLENFGAYRVEGELGSKGKKGKSEVVFHLNDFDDTSWGPIRWDVLRLVTSALVFSNEIGASLTDSLTLASSLLDGYDRARTRGDLPKPPKIVERLLETASRRSRQDLLEARTTLMKGERRFQRGEHFEDLQPEIHAAAVDAFARYMLALVRQGHTNADQLEPRDFAFRIAGVGSLGCLRVAVLTRGKGGVEGEWLFDMKEEGTPSIATAKLDERGFNISPPGPPPATAAARVLEGVHALAFKRPRMIGETTLLEKSMLVRWLAPQEDKLSIADVAPEDRLSLVHFLGSLLGEAHRQSAPKAPRWTREDLDALLHRGLALAALHQVAFAEYAIEAKKR